MTEIAEETKKPRAKRIAIKGFTSLTKQQMFDIAVKHIGSTGVKSVVEGSNSCIYTGTGCNAAPFLTKPGRAFADAPYSNSGNLGGKNWYGLTRDGNVPKHESEFVQELQHAHDRSDKNDFQPQYHRFMTSLAQRHDLNTDALDALGWK